MYSDLKEFAHITQSYQACRKPSVLEALQIAHPKMKHLGKWREALESSYLPKTSPGQVISVMTSEYLNAVAYLHQYPESLGELYEKMSHGLIPTHISKMISDALTLCLSLPESGIAEIISYLHLDNNHIPEHLPVPQFASNTNAVSYLSLIDALETYGKPNTVNRTFFRKNRSTAFPFFLGYPTEKLEELWNLTRLSLLGCHPLFTPIKKRPMYSFDSLTGQKAQRVLAHDDDHLAEQSIFHFRRARNMLDTLDFTIPPRSSPHRNLLIPLFFVDFCFNKEIIVCQEETWKSNTKPVSSLGINIDKALLFAHHEEQSTFLPPCLVQEGIGFIHNSLTLKDSLLRYIERWKTPEDLRNHFTQEEHKIYISRRDITASFERINNSIEIAYNRFSNLVTIPEELSPLAASLIPAFNAWNMTFQESQFKKWKDEMKKTIRFLPEVIQI